MKRVLQAVTLGILPCTMFDAAAQVFHRLGKLPGSTYSEALAVSADGEWVVGRSQPWAFLWSAATGMVKMEYPGASDTVATGVSDGGSVVVGWADFSAGEPSGWRWTIGDGFTPIGTVHPTAVSADGRVVVGKTGNSFVGLPFVWTEAEGLVVLANSDTSGDSTVVVSRDGAIVASALSPGGGGRLWRNLGPYGWSASLMEGNGCGIPGIADVRAMSHDGRFVVGTIRVEAQSYVPGLWTYATGPLFWPERPDCSGHNPYVVAVADGGQVAIGSRASSAGIWDSRNGWRNLACVLSAAGADLGGWYQPLTRVNGISADGLVIVGYGIPFQGEQEAWVVRLPAIPPTADFNRDGFVDGQDYDMFVTIFEAGGALADFNEDSFVDGIDYDQFVLSFDAGC